jgi:hypothetical protein
LRSGGRANSAGRFERSEKRASAHGFALSGKPEGRRRNDRSHPPQPGASEASEWWRRMDSNHRRAMPSRFTVCPLWPLGYASNRARKERSSAWSRHPESNRGPTVYKTVALPLSYAGGCRSSHSTGFERGGLLYPLAPRRRKQRPGLGAGTGAGPGGPSRPGWRPVDTPHRPPQIFWFASRSVRCRTAS